MARGWFEAIDVVGQPQQEGLETLGCQRPARRSGGELALDRREDAVHQRPLAVQRPWELSLHLGTNTLPSPVSSAPPGRDDAVGPHYFTDMTAVALAVEFRIGQDQAKRRHGGGGIHYRPQGGRIVGWTPLGHLGQKNLFGYVHRDQPFEVVEPSPRSLARLTKKVLMAPEDRPVASTATVVPPEDGGGSLRTTSARARVRVFSSGLLRK